MFPPPPAFSEIDPQTVTLLRFDEGRGNTVYDTGGFDGGASNGGIYPSASPPKWEYSDLNVRTWIFLPSVFP